MWLLHSEACYASEKKAVNSRDTEHVSTPLKQSSENCRAFLQNVTYLVVYHGIAGWKRFGNNLSSHQKGPVKYLWYLHAMECCVLSTKNEAEKLKT